MNSAPLGETEKYLLDAFLEFLRTDDREEFRLKCRLLDGLVQAAKAKARLNANAKEESNSRMEGGK